MNVKRTSLATAWLIGAVIVVGASGCVAPPEPAAWMQPQCFQIVAGYPDVRYDGPQPNVLGNANEYLTKDKTCGGTALPGGGTVVRATTQSEADLTCSTVYSLPPGGAFGIPIGNPAEGRPADAWYCAFGG